LALRCAARDLLSSLGPQCDNRSESESDEQAEQQVRAFDDGIDQRPAQRFEGGSGCKCSSAATKHSAMSPHFAVRAQLDRAV
jgi:hypothetical protein